MRRVVPIVVAAVPIAAGYACGGAPAPTASAPATASISPVAPTPCEMAGVARGRARALVAAGELDRAPRVLDYADALCPSSAPDSASLRASITAAVRPASTAAPVGGEALVGQGLDALASGDAAAAHALLARGLAQLETETGTRIALHAIDERAVPLYWFPGGDLRFALGRQGPAVWVRDQRLGRATRAFEVGLPQDPDPAFFALSPESARIAAGDGSATAVWDARSGTKLAGVSATGEIAWLDGTHLALVALDPSSRGYSAVLAKADGSGIDGSVTNSGGRYLDSVVRADRIVTLEERTAEQQTTTMGAGLGGFDTVRTVTTTSIVSRWLEVASHARSVRTLASDTCTTVERVERGCAACGPQGGGQATSRSDGRAVSRAPCDVSVLVGLSPAGDRAAIRTNRVTHEDLPPGPLTGLVSSPLSTPTRIVKGPPRTRVFDTHTGIVVAGAPVPQPRTVRRDFDGFDPSRARAVDVAVSADGTRIAVALADGAPVLFDAATNVVKHLQSVWNPPPRVLVTRDGGSVFGAYTEGGVARFAGDCASPCQETWRFGARSSQTPVYLPTVAIRADGSEIAVRSRSGPTYVLDAATGGVTATLAGKPGMGHIVGFAPDGSVIVPQLGQIELRARDGSVARSLDGGTVELDAMVVAGSRLLSLAGTTLTAWDLATGTTAWTAYVEPQSDSLAATADGATVCATSADRTATPHTPEVTCFAVSSGTVLSSTPGGPRFAIASDGSLLYVTRPEGVGVVRLATGAPVARLSAAWGKDILVVRDPGERIEVLGADAPQGAWCTAGVVVLPLAACEGRFQTPHLFPQLVAGGPIEP